MELALAVAVDSSWPVHVRRTALLLVSVLCRGSAEAVQHFRQLEVSFLCPAVLCPGNCLQASASANVQASVDADLSNQDTPTGQTWRLEALH